MKVKRNRQVTPSYNVEVIYNQVESLIGKPVKVEVMISNGKIKTEEGIITAVYANLFLLECIKKSVRFKYTYTFIDIYTKRVIIKNCE